MERVLDFSDVTSYDFSLMGSGMILKLFQGDVITKIQIDTGKPTTVVSNRIQHQKAVAERANQLTSLIEEKQPTTVSGSVIKRRKLPIARLNVNQVKEIRSNWEATVKACGSRNAAAEQLSRIYNCSAKNIHAIIYRYSWTHV